MNNEKKRYKCSYCSKHYASRQGKSRHQKNCNKKPVIIEKTIEETQKINFGMEDTSFIKSNYLDLVLQSPYKMLQYLLYKIYFKNNKTVQIDNKDINSIKIIKNNKWTTMNKDEALLDMIDRTYTIIDMYFTYEGGESKLNEKYKNNYCEFQNSYDNNDSIMKGKLLQDVRNFLIESKEPSIYNNVGIESEF